MFKLMLRDLLWRRLYG